MPAARTVDEDSKSPTKNTSAVFPDAVQRQSERQRANLADRGAPTRQLTKSPRRQVGVRGAHEEPPVVRRQFAFEVTPAALQYKKPVAVDRRVILRVDHRDGGLDRQAQELHSERA
jgi:hypothetical protein